MEKGLTSYVLNYLLSTCFDSKADMARQLDMSKRALQRVMNEPQLSKGGSVALVALLLCPASCPCGPDPARVRGA